MGTRLRPEAHLGERELKAPLKLADVLRIVRAVRIAETATSEVKIERLASGCTNLVVKASGRDLRRVSKKAQECYDALRKKYPTS